MNGKRRTAFILVLVLCVLALTGSLAEARPVSTEENGRVVRTVWTDDAGEACTGPEGYAEVRYSYTRETETEKYFDAAGEPCMDRNGTYGRTVTRDGKGQVIQIEYLGADGKRTLNNLGYGLMTIAYTSFGAERVVNYYGLKKKTMVPSLGYASVVMDYSGRMLQRREYLDEQGKPVDIPAGYAIMQLTKKKNEVRIRYLHADESPAIGPDGWYRCIQELDAKGRITSVKYYDEREQLTDRGAGYAWEEYTYGDGTVTVTRYDLKGQKTAFSGEAVSIRRKMKDDRVTEETWLNAEGEETFGPLGISTTAYTYDAQGRIETVRYLNAAGESVLCSQGYAGYRDTRDEDGATVSRVYLGTDGQKTNTVKGYCEERYLYNAAKQLDEVRYFDADGNMVSGQ